MAKEKYNAPKQSDQEVEHAPAPASDPLIKTMAEVEAMTDQEKQSFREKCGITSNQ